MGHWRQCLALFLPAQVVADAQGLAPLGRVVGHPVGHDIVIGLVGGGNQHQLDAARPPVPPGCHPGAGTQVVTCLEILVLMKGAVTLHQAEALQLFGRETGHLQPLWVHQRPPQPFLIGLHRQAIRVVHLGPVVGMGGILVFAEQVHAGQRGQPQFAAFLAHVDLGANRHARTCVGMQLEAVGAGQARRVHQRVDDQMPVVRAGAGNPEFDELGKLFARHLAGVQRHAACRQPVALPGAQGAEVARTLKHQHFVLVRLVVDRKVHAKARKTQRGLGVAHGLAIDVVGAVIEQVGVERHGPHAVGGDQVDVHRPAIVEAGVQKLHFERQIAVAPQGLAGVEAYRAVLVVVQRREGRRQRDLGLLVTRFGQLPGARGDLVEAESLHPGGEKNRGQQQQGPEQMHGVPVPP